MNKGTSALGAAALSLGLATGASAQEEVSSKHIVVPEAKALVAEILSCVDNSNPGNVKYFEDGAQIDDLRLSNNSVIYNLDSISFADFAVLDGQELGTIGDFSYDSWSVSGGDNREHAEKLVAEKYLEVLHEAKEKACPSILR